MVFYGGAMVDSCLDSRIAEAAAAVEALRREKEKMDSQILHHHLEAPILHASCAESLQNRSLDRLEHTFLDENQIRPGSAAKDVPHCIFWAPQSLETAPPSLKDQMVAPVTVQLSVEATTDQRAAIPDTADLTRTEDLSCTFEPLPTLLAQRHCDLTRTEEVPPPSIQDSQDAVIHEAGYDLWVLSPAKSQTFDESVFMQQAELPQDYVVTTTACAFPVPPSAPAPTTRPPRRAPPRPKQNTEQANHPSDVAVASMSRRERIALLEKEDASGLDRPVSELVVHEHEIVHAIPDNLGTNHERAAVMEQEEYRIDCNRGVIGDSIGNFGESNSAWQRRSAIEQRPRPSVVVFPSDEAVAQMSRRERIALLERAESGSPEEDVLPPRLDGSTSRHRDNSATRSRPDIANRRQIAPSGRSGALTCQSASPDQESPSSTGCADDGLDDEAWLEQRRQNRKMRLQRVPRLEGSSTCKESSADVRQAVHEAMMSHDADLEIGRSLQPAHMDGRRRIPRNGMEGGEGNADESHANRFAAAGRCLAEELEEFARLSADDPKWPSFCSSLAANAHKLSSGALVRAIQIVASLSITLCVHDNVCENQATNAFRSAVDAVLVCITPQLGSLSIGVIVDALTAMATIRIQEQSYLDMLLAQLLVLLRRDPGNFNPGKLAAIAHALGSLYVAGVSAKRAGSGPSSVANQRCLDSLGVQITAKLEDFSAAELGQIGGTFMITFVDDTLRRSFLHRAAELEAGLAIGTSRREHTDMQEIEQSMRQHSFAFICSLPDTTKDYLTKLKAAPTPATAMETVTGCS